MGPLPELQTTLETFHCPTSQSLFPVYLAILGHCCFPEGPFKNLVICWVNTRQSPGCPAHLQWDSRRPKVQAELGAYVTSPSKVSDSPRAQLLQMPSGQGRMRPEAPSSLDLLFWKQICTESAPNHSSQGIPTGQFCPNWRSSGLPWIL